MEYQKAISIYNRMCSNFDGATCKSCPLNHNNNDKDKLCVNMLYEDPKTAELILEKWDKEHPKRTILTEFLEYYPDARLAPDGTPDEICPHSLGYTNIAGCLETTDYNDICIKCWDRTPEEAKKGEVNEQT